MPKSRKKTGKRNKNKHHHEIPKETVFDPKKLFVFAKNITLSDLQGNWVNSRSQNLVVTDTSCNGIEIQDEKNTFVYNGWGLDKQSKTLTWKRSNEKDVFWYRKCRNCPRFHGLKSFTTPKEGLQCNDCYKDSSEGDNMYGCKSCDFALCMNCWIPNNMGQSKKKKKNIKARAAKIDKSTHSTFFGKSPNRKKKLCFCCLNKEVRSGQEFSILDNGNKDDRELAKIAAKRAWRTAKNINVIQIQNKETGKTYNFRSEEWKTIEFFSCTGWHKKTKPTSSQILSGNPQIFKIQKKQKKNKFRQ